MTAPALPHDWFARPLPHNVVIGDGSWLYSAFAFVHCRSTRPTAVSIGRHCSIHAGSFFDLGEGGSVEVGDWTALVGVVFATDGAVRIGRHCLVAHPVVVAAGAVVDGDVPPDTVVAGNPARVVGPAGARHGGGGAR